MRTEYSHDYPLGFNENKYSPEITRYLSWQELFEITRTNIFTDKDGKKYQLPESKDDKPLITYKGNYGIRRLKENLTERSPYVAIDIDIDEAVSSLNKKKLSNDDRQKAADDLEMITSILTDGKKNFFFCKRTSSGCGLHIILKIVGVQDGKMDLYEKNIFLKIQESLDSPEIKHILSFRYKVDMAMLSDSQALHINHDPHAIFNPDKSIQATLYQLKTEYGEGLVGQNETVFPIRLPNDVDRRMFLQFEKYCTANKIRIDYPCLRNLSIIFLILWPEGTCEDFFEKCKGFNEERSKNGTENKRFMLNLYKNLKRNTSREYKCKKISLGSLYYIMGNYNYQYLPEQEIHFTGYLESVEARLFEAFKKHDKILLEAPTGSGKTLTMFKYLKKLASENPTKNFVIALPYTGMAEQFASENSDSQFRIKVLHGTKNGTFPGYIQLSDSDENVVKKNENVHEIFFVNDAGFIENSKQAFEKTNPEFRKRNRKSLKKTKKKLRKNEEIKPIALFEPQLKYHNLWCTTYDSACRIRNIHTLIIDEAHDTVKQIEFRQEALRSLDTLSCKKRIFITATPDALIPDAEDFYHLKCIKDDTVKPLLSIQKVKGTITAALMVNIRETHSSLSFFNDKKLCGHAQDILKNEGVNVNLYNSDTKKEPHQVLLQEEGIMSGHGLATSYLLEGFNVLNPDIERINICSEYDIDSIRQGAARSRKCQPEIRLIQKDTLNTIDLSQKFNRAYEYAKKLSKLQALADELNGLLLSDRISEANANRFKAFEEDLKYIYKSDVSEPQFPRPDFLKKFPQRFIVDEPALKFEINNRYVYWLSHCRNDLWLKKLSEHFTLGSTTFLQNEATDPKKIGLNFEIFKEADKELVAKFHHHNTQKKSNKKSTYDQQMSDFSETHNKIQFTKGWETWTTRYLKMVEYGAEINFEIIKSGKAYSYWQRQADMAISITEGGSTAKETKIAYQNKTAVEYLLNVNVINRNLTSTELFSMMNLHLQEKGLPIIKNQKSFFASVKSVLKIKRKQVRGTGIRYIKSIADISSDSPFKTEQIVNERLASGGDDKYDLL